MIPSGNQRPTSLCFTGDVTALSIASIPNPHDTKQKDLLLAGIGSQLHAFSIPSGRHLFATTVLPFGIRIHGIAARSTSKTPTWIAVHGDKYIALLSISHDCCHCQQRNVYTLGHQEGSVNNMPNKYAVSTANLLPRFSHWILSIKISSHNTITKKECTDAFLFIGLSNNSVEIYSINEKNRMIHDSYDKNNSIGALEHGLLCRVECSYRCLLYSMDLHCVSSRKPDFLIGNKESSNNVDTQQCIVAGGTVYLDVVIWKATTNAKATTTTVEPLYKLYGHQGSIHTVRWNPHGLILATGSDDRTVRIWNISPSIYTVMDSSDDGIISNATIKAQHVLFGHASRIWNACFSDENEDGSCSAVMVSCSEDGCCKFWDIKHGKELADLKAHKHRGVWHCLLHDMVLYTAGAEGSIKAWLVWDYIPPCHILPSGTPQAKWQCPWKVAVMRLSSLIASAHDNVNKKEIKIPIFPDDMLRNHSSSGHTTSLTVPDFMTDTPITEQVWSHGEEKESSGMNHHAAGEKEERVRSFAFAKQCSLLFVSSTSGGLYMIDVHSMFAAATNSNTQKKFCHIVYESERKLPLGPLDIKETNLLANGIRVIGCDAKGYAVVADVSMPDHHHHQPNRLVINHIVEWCPDEGYTTCSALIVHGEDAPLSWVLTSAMEGRVSLWSISSLKSICLGTRKSSVNAKVAVASLCYSIETSLATSNQQKFALSRIQTTWIMALGTSTGCLSLWRIECDLTTDIIHEFYELSCVRYAHGKSPVQSVQMCWICDGPFGKRLELQSTAGDSSINIFQVDERNYMIRKKYTRYDPLLRIVNTWSQAPALRSSPAMAYGYHTLKFAVWDEGLETIALTVYSGNWRKAVAASIASPPQSADGGNKDSAVGTSNVIYPENNACDATQRATPIVSFVHENAGEIVLYLRNHHLFCSTDEVSTPSTTLPRALLSPCHGSEINTVHIFSLPSSILCVTGGEDSMLRQSWCPVAVNDSNSGYFRSVIIGQSLGGSIKAMDIVQIESNTWLLINGASKHALSAYILCMSEHGHPQEDSYLTRTMKNLPLVLKSDWISNHIPSTTHLKKPSRNIGPNMRCLALSIIVPNPFGRPVFLPEQEKRFAGRCPSLCFVATSSSDGAVGLYAFHSDHRPPALCYPWPCVASLQYHMSPVLSMQYIAVQKQYIVLTGATDGTLVVWNVTPEIQEYHQSFLAFVSSYLSTSSMHDVNTQYVGIDKYRIQQRWDERVVHPVFVLHGVHQSGVNSMSVACLCTSGGRDADNDDDNGSSKGSIVVVATGGDDQSLCVTLLHFRQGGKDKNGGSNDDSCCGILSQIRQENAHSSAVRAVWTDGRILFTVGLDQKLRKWRMVRNACSTVRDDDCVECIDDENNADVMCLTEVGEATILQVLEPNALHVTSEDAYGHKVAVAGKGMQVIDWPCLDY